MKKVVLISDGINFSKKTFEFLQSVYENEPFLLTGAFFHSINYSLLIPSTFAPSAAPYLAFTRQEHDDFINGIRQFETLCCKHNIEHNVHRESDEWNVDDLVKESRFADVVVVSGERLFSNVEEEQPNRFLREVLVSTECPVLVIPEDAVNIRRIAIAYNGKKESMFALKMFCYIFPGFANLPVDIYYWVRNTDDEIPDLDYLIEFAGRHFPDLNFREVFFDPDNYLEDWMKDKKDTLFICGSYHRSKISTLFKKSFAENIIKKHSASVFIAHP